MAYTDQQIRDYAVELERKGAPPEKIREFVSAAAKDRVQPSATVEPDTSVLKNDWADASPLQRLKLLVTHAPAQFMETTPQTMQTMAKPLPGIAATGIEAAGAAGGMALGGPPGAFAGAMAGNAAAQGIRNWSGDQQGFKPGQMVGSGVASMIPGSSMAGASLKRFAGEAGKFAAGNMAGKAAETGIDEGRLPTLNEMELSGGLGAAAAPIARFSDAGAVSQKAAARQMQQSIKQATLDAARDVGYVVTPASVNPSSLNNILESFAGKASTAQEAQLRNAEITNALARKEMGLPIEAPLSKAAITEVRKNAATPYIEVSKLSPEAAAISDDLKQARFNASAAWAKSDDPTLLKEARAYDADAEALEAKLEAIAKAAGRPGLVDQLRDSRKLISKTYVLENSLNQGDGAISADRIGRMLDNGAKFTEGLETIAKFQQAFGRNIRDQAKVPPPGVNHLRFLASVGAGAGGASQFGPAGAMLGAVPMMAEGPARNMLLSKFYQQNQAQMRNPGLRQPDFASSLARFTTQNQGR